MPSPLHVWHLISPAPEQSTHKQVPLPEHDAHSDLLMTEPSSTTFGTYSLVLKASASWSASYPLTSMLSTPNLEVLFLRNNHSADNTCTYLSQSFGLVCMSTVYKLDNNDHGPNNYKYTGIHGTHHYLNRLQLSQVFFVSI